MAGEVTFQMTEADYVAANREWFLRAVFKRRVIVRYAIAVVASFVFGAVLAGLDNNVVWMGQIWQGLLTAAAVFVVLAIINAGHYALIPRRAGKLFRQHTGLHKPVTFAWADDGMTQTSAHGGGTYAWGDLRCWTAGSGAILPYVTDQLYFVVPRRILSDDQAEDLIATLEGSGLPRG